jgi:3-oxoacyl-[acyl-carrier protein] reductase
MNRPPLPLAGKVALVSGGLIGLGAAIVRRLAAEGADVCFAYFRSFEVAKRLAKELENSGRQVLCVRTDRTQPHEVEDLVWQAHDRFGQLDITVTSSGIFVPAMTGDLSVSRSELSRQLDINVVSAAVAVRTAAPLMNDGGRIVTIVSADARTDKRGVADFSATQAALAAYTEGWSRDLAPRAITANIVRAGLYQQSFETDGQLPGVKEEPSSPSLCSALRAEHIAGAVAFLAGPDAACITGASLAVDGGQR